MNEAIQLIIGPMFSGKSTELIRRLERYTISKRSIVVIKYTKDDRYDEEKIHTHSGKKGCFETLIMSKNIEDAPDLSAYDVIGIDEGQFFDKIADFAEHYAKKNKIVVVAALNGTFERKPFESIVPLFSLAERIDHLTAICIKCGKDASFSKRLNHSTNVELIGDNKLYEARCRRCFDS